MNLPRFVADVELPRPDGTPMLNAENCSACGDRAWVMTVGAWKLCRACWRVCCLAPAYELAARRPSAQTEMDALIEFEKEIAGLVAAEKSHRDK